MSAATTIEHGQDLIEHTIGQLLAEFESCLPDLSRIVVFLPASGDSLYFRARLLARLPDDCNRAVIPPWLGTIREWVNDFIPLPEGSHTVISEQARRLLFIEALEQYPALFRDENKWQVTLALLRLFDELNLYTATVSDAADEWLDTVQRAYGIDHKHAHLQQEASLVHTLWHAWHQQLHAGKLLDATSAYILRLHHAQQLIQPELHFYAASTDTLAPCETDFIEALSRSKQCTVLQYSDDSDAGSDEVCRFISQAFDYHLNPLKRRAELYRQECSSLSLPFSIYPACDAEHEARAVELQIRKWLLCGKKTIGVVSEDRKLSRRLRALLERANIPLQDMAGWSLSTTSAAATLERWLECIEEDFDQRPMLDLCKSHFFTTEASHEDRLQTIYRLERDIIQHENIGHGIPRYRKQLAYRLKRLEHWPKNTYDDVIAILDHLQSCAESLTRLYHSEHNKPLSEYLSALLDSLKQLGVERTFLDDPAGIRIMQTLQDMQQSLAHSNPCLGWNDFRTWLGMTLEEQLFSPQTGTSPVQLMTLEQSSLKRFDALVIAAADDEHIPGSAESSPFFNQGARKALGLEDWERKRAQRLTLFRRLLLAAPEILISYKSEDNGEPLPVSPWIEALENFYKLSFDRSLLNTTLGKQLEQTPFVFVCDTDELPAIANRPCPTVPASLSPGRISAGAHQRLINCPYQFFSGDSLGLRPADEISEELKKSNYGERVHRILQAFHQQTRNLPAPFTETITPENREAAIQHLNQLSETVFRQDLEDNSLHRSWLHRWLKHVPAYIDWQMSQQQQWSITQTEQKIEIPLTASTSLFGRLDRIDSNADAEAIIDYKTGRSASQKDVDTGEDVQLVSYALLSDSVEQVSFLSLDEPDGRVRTGASLAGDALNALKQDTRERLLSMLEMTAEGAALHAWGDTETCNYCNFAGLCRRPVWKP